MLYSTAFALACLLGLGLFVAFRWWTLWSWRTAVLLGAAGGIVVLVDALSFPVPQAIQVGTVTGLLLVVFTKNEALSAITAEDRTFVNAYAAMGDNLDELRKGIGKKPHDEYLQELDRIATALEQASAPSAEWADLQKDVVNEIRLRTDLIAAGRPVDDSAVANAKERWSDLEKRLATILRNRANFWLVWP